MGLLEMIGWGKNPLLEWFINTYHLEATELRDSHRYVSEGAHAAWLWKGKIEGREISIPTGPTGNKRRITGPELHVNIGEAGDTPDLVFYRTDNTADLPSFGDPGWREKLDDGGVLLGEFCIDPECRRELLEDELLQVMKGLLDRLSEGVLSVSVFLPGAGVEFDVKGTDVMKVSDDLRIVTDILCVVTKKRQ